jgi:pimeloyl-ACP methyl ester carboxylesterase
MKTIYLHGFASGPLSRKAQFFRERFEERGLALDIPLLDEGDFERLTVTAQLKLLERLSGGEPVSLIGSSMGGYVAALYASRHPEVKKLVMLAPAFYFPKRWMDQLDPDKAAAWKRNGTMPVFHYSEGRMRDIGYQLVKDADSYEPAPNVTQPALIFHGLHDDVVPADYSREFAAAHPANVKLHLLNSGHALTDVLETIWQEAEAFLVD